MYFIRSLLLKKNCKEWTNIIFIFRKKLIEKDKNIPFELYVVDAHICAHKRLNLVMLI